MKPSSTIRWIFEIESDLVRIHLLRTRIEIVLSYVLKYKRTSASMAMFIIGINVMTCTKFMRHNLQNMSVSDSTFNSVFPTNLQNVVSNHLYH